VRKLSKVEKCGTAIYDEYVSEIGKIKVMIGKNEDLQYLTPSHIISFSLDEYRKLNCRKNLY